MDHAQRPATAARTPAEKAARIVLIAVLGFTPFLIVPGIEEYTLPPRLLFLQSCLLIPLLLWSGGRGPTDWRRPRTMLPLLVFLMVLTFSVFWALNPFRATYDLVKYATLLLLFLCVVQLLDSDDLGPLLRAHALAGLGVSLIGISEHVGWLPEWIPSTGRPSATFGYRNLAGAYLAVGIPLAAILFAVARNSLDRWIGAVASSMMLVFLLYTKARASWVGLFLGLCAGVSVWLVSAPRSILPTFRLLLSRSRAVALIVSVGAAGALVAVPKGFSDTHIQRFDERKTDIATTVRSIFEKGGDRGRKAMWRGTMSMIANHPILGVGLGNWEYHYPLFDTEKQLEPKFVPLRPHNDLLWIWSESGTIGITAYIAFLVMAVFGSRRQFRSGRFEDRLIAVGLVGSVAAYVGVGMFTFPWERMPPSILFWLALGFLSLAGVHSRAAESLARRYIRRLALPTLCLALFVTIQHTRFDYHFLRAYKSYLLGDSQALAYHSGRAIDLGPFDHQAYVLRGESAMRRGNPAEAERYFRKTLQYHPNFANAYNSLGLARFEQGDLDGALQNYRTATRIVPRHYLARYNQGIVFQQQGELDSAIVAYRQSFHTNNSKPYVNLGLVYRHLDKPDSAEAVWKRAVSVFSASHEAWYNLANLYLDQGRHEEALGALDSFIVALGSVPHYAEEARKSKWEALNGMGVKAEQGGDFAAAVDLYTRGTELAPDYYLAWFNLGNGLRGATDPRRAADAYRKSITLEPGHVDSHNNLGLSLSESGKSAEAVKAYRKALDLDPRHPAVNYNLGNTLLGMQDTTGAEAAYAVFAEEWEGDPALRDFYLANVYAQMGRDAAAGRLFKSFLAVWKGEDDMTKVARQELARMKVNQN